MQVDLYNGRKTVVVLCEYFFVCLLIFAVAQVRWSYYCLALSRQTPAAAILWLYTDQLVLAVTFSSEVKDVSSLKN